MLDPNTSPEARRKLAEADDTSADILEELSGDRDRTIRSFVAKNVYTSADTLENLAADSDFAVRYGVAKNPHTRVEVLQTLTTDKYQTVATAAKKRLQKTKLRSH